MAPHEYSEDTLVEQPAIQLLEKLGWESINAFSEFDSGTSNLGRDNKGQVVLVERLRPALEKLNPKLPAEAINLAIEELSRDRSALDPVAANREVYELLKNGIKVTYQGDDEGILEMPPEDSGFTCGTLNWSPMIEPDFVTLQVRKAPSELNYPELSALHIVVISRHVRRFNIVSRLFYISSRFRKVCMRCCNCFVVQCRCGVNLGVVASR